MRIISKWTRLNFTGRCWRSASRHAERSWTHSTQARTGHPDQQQGRRPPCHLLRKAVQTHRPLSRLCEMTTATKRKGSASHEHSPKSPTKILKIHFRWCLLLDVAHFSSRAALTSLLIFVTAALALQQICCRPTSFSLREAHWLESSSRRSPTSSAGSHSSPTPSP